MPVRPLDRDRPLTAADRAARDLEAACLRARGVPIAEIGIRLNVSPSHIYRRLAQFRAVRLTPLEPVR